MLFRSVIIAALLTVAWAQHYQMVPTGFNATAWTGLKSCVGATKKDYHVVVDKGQLVFVPPTDIAPIIDMSTTDVGLRECLSLHSDYLNLAADSTRYITSNLSTVSFDTASVTWAQQEGVQGIELVMKNVTSRAEKIPTAGVERRLTGPGYYYAYLDQFYRGCQNHDMDTAYTSQCRSPGPKYYSAKFGNADRCLVLQVCAWFHHKCAVDYSASERARSRRCTTIGPGRDSACRNDDTFSWKGDYFQSNCCC